MSHAIEGTAKIVEYNVPGIRPVTVRSGNINVRIQEGTVTIDGKDCTVTGHGEHQNICITVALGNCAVEWKEKPAEFLP